MELCMMSKDKKVSELKENQDEGLDEEDLFQEILRNKYGEDFEINPENKKDFDPYIIVDMRERGSGIVEELEDLGANVVVETLDAGDYLLSSNVAVERKRGDDFYGSLFSGSNQTNVFEELIRLKDSVDTPMLILEHFSFMFRRGEKMINSLYGALVAIATQMNIPILPTRSISDTAIVLYRISKQQQGELKVNAIARRAPKTMSIKERQTFFLEGLFNVGPKKAESLIEEFKCPINFLTELMGTNILYTRTGNPKGIDGKLAEIKGFGVKFVRQNQKLLSAEEEDDI
ncbi:MAG: hypothetical protein GF364_17675 [Candidatus Lokiarchaeota archaeon]|nr:hypothetical protein [Candidatus Lokiarchaeota archaeon]